jgi:hypothetical protein
MMRTPGTLLSIIILTGFYVPRCEATIYSSNGSAADVQRIHDTQAQNGDTITLPAGIFTWTTGVIVTKAITLQGAGVGVTILKDDVQSGQLILWTLAAGYPSRITGIEFQDGGRINVISAPAGVLHVNGSNTNGSTFRFDHSEWNNLKGPTVFDTVIGVIDHNTFITDTGFSIPFYAYATTWDGQLNGDGSWAAATGFGSSQFLFLENNTFTHSTATMQSASDAYAGARFVFRYNAFINNTINNHGTESTGRTRGGRAVEVYNNIFTGTGLNKYVGGIRSGGVLFHDNGVSGYWGNSALFSLTNVRNYMPFVPWGGADGTSVWDVN